MKACSAASSHPSRGAAGAGRHLAWALIHPITSWHLSKHASPCPTRWKQKLLSFMLLPIHKMVAQTLSFAGAVLSEWNTLRWPPRDKHPRKALLEGAGTSCPSYFISLGTASPKKAQSMLMNESTSYMHNNCREIITGKIYHASVWLWFSSKKHKHSDYTPHCLYK